MKQLKEKAEHLCEKLEKWSELENKNKKGRSVKYPNKK